MSLVPLAAALIRRTLADESYAIDLELAIEDRVARRGLVDQLASDHELGALSPTEWLWFAQWRQQHGGALDPIVLEFLGSVGIGRPQRFALRGLVMRDRRTVRDVATADATESTGLQWLATHVTVSDPVELARDALQHATPVAWWVIDRLVTDERHRRAATDFLEAFAATVGAASRDRPQ
jgi:hypothetical protein